MKIALMLKSAVHITHSMMRSQSVSMLPGYCHASSIFRLLLALPWASHDLTTLYLINSSPYRLPIMDSTFSAVNSFLARLPFY